MYWNRNGQTSPSPTFRIFHKGFGLRAPGLCLLGVNRNKDPCCGLSRKGAGAAVALANEGRSLGNGKLASDRLSSDRVYRLVQFRA